MKSVCNVDWVELYCNQDNPALSRDFSFEVSDGLYTFRLFLREYGTRVYSHVWNVTINGQDFATICCCPLSAKGTGGILDDHACHVKVANYWLYTDKWFDMLSHALGLLVINPRHAARIDICCDWQYLRCGLSGGALMSGIVQRKFVKVHQPQWAVHGIDTDKHLHVNSIGFGSKQSSVYTRFYNKSFELATSGKTYIAEMWQNVGFTEGVPVYRVEFAMQDLGLRSVDKSTGCCLEIDWKRLGDREYIEEQFLYYAAYYFDVRKADNARKYRCTPISLFAHSEMSYKAWQNPRNVKSSRTSRMVINYLRDNAASLGLSPDATNALMQVLYTEMFNANITKLYEDRERERPIVGAESNVDECIMS